MSGGLLHKYQAPALEMPWLRLVPCRLRQIGLIANPEIIQPLDPVFRRLAIDMVPARLPRLRIGEHDIFAGSSIDGQEVRLVAGLDMFNTRSKGIIQNLCYLNLISDEICN